MTSERDREAFVWIWLPGEVEPVVAGRLEVVSGRLHFNYGKRYLERGTGSQGPISIYEPELPLRAGRSTSSVRPRTTSRVMSTMCNWRNCLIPLSVSSGDYR